MIRNAHLVILFFISNLSFAMDTKQKTEGKRKKETKHVIYSKDDTHFYATRFLILRNLLKPLHGKGWYTRPFYSEILCSSIDIFGPKGRSKNKAQDDIELPPQKKLDKHSFMHIRDQAYDVYYFKHYHWHSACENMGITSQQYASLQKKMDDYFEKVVKRTQYWQKCEKAYGDMLSEGFDF